jgi:hypothetical protein
MSHARSTPLTFSAERHVTATEDARYLQPCSAGRCEDGIAMNWLRPSGMLRDAVESVLRTHGEQIIRLLAKAFARGALANDDAAIDEAQEIERLVVELDPVDLRALLALRDRFRGSGHRVGCLIHEPDITSATASVINARLERLGPIGIERSSSFDPDRPS